MHGPRIGCNVFFPENRKHIFTVTSIDDTNYDINRRSIYLPVIRNHVYDFFQLFDFPDLGIALLESEVDAKLSYDIFAYMFPNARDRWDWGDRSLYPFARAYFQVGESRWEPCAMVEANPTTIKSLHETVTRSGTYDRV